jgi:hypothetical protein
VARQNASAAGVEVQELGVEALPQSMTVPLMSRDAHLLPSRSARFKYPIEAPPVLRTLLAPPKRRRYSRWRFAAGSLTCPEMSWPACL